MVEGPPGAEAAERELRPDAVASLSRGRTVAVEPLGAGRYKVQFTASAALKGKLERLQALMRSSGSGVDLAAVIEAAVTEKLERLEARRFARSRVARKALEHTAAAPAAPAPAAPAATTTAATTRHIPAAVRRAVHERDAGRCRYVDAHGRRCSEQNRLEFHHRYPFGRGGDHSPPNIALLCRVHNALMAEHDYGTKTLVRNRGRGGRGGH
jgi:hypothetical protein